MDKICPEEVCERVVERTLHSYSEGLATHTPDVALRINCAVFKATRRIKSRNCAIIGVFNFTVNARQ